MSTKEYVIMESVIVYLDLKESIVQENVVRIVIITGQHIVNMENFLEMIVQQIAMISGHNVIIILNKEISQDKLMISGHNVMIMLKVTNINHHLM
jgi:hypothetical protein